MKNIKLMNKIAKVGLSVLDTQKYNVSDNVEAPDAIMVRSAKLHDLEFNSELSAIARCGAGTNNIPVERCTENGIVVFNTPGANANGVKELAICALIMAARDVVGGIDFAKGLVGNSDVAKAVEAGKGAYVGGELLGKTLGVIGLGAIGGMLAGAALALGMNVIGYDPYISARAAWNISPSVKQAFDYDEIYKNCDFISLHVPATPTTKNMICARSLSLMKDGVKIINLARADLVSAPDIKAAIAEGKVARYVTDFPTNETVGESGIINIPHLGASTYEAEDQCAIMAARELDEYLSSGNIKNSVNFPSVTMPLGGKERFALMHKNVPNMLSQITSVFSGLGINISNLANGSRGDIAYTIVEADGESCENALTEKLMAIDGVIKVRIY